MKKSRDFVNKARYALKMTQKEFAQAIGRSSRTVKRWEAGETECSYSDTLAIIRLCKDSGVEIDTIVFLFDLTRLSHCYSYDDFIVLLIIIYDRMKV